MFKTVCRIMWIMGAVIAFAGCSSHQPSLPIVYGNAPVPIVWPDSELEESFNEYWSYWSNKRFDKTYSMEAPYIRELTSADTYRSLFSTDRVLNQIEVLKIEPVNNKFYHVSIKLFYTNSSGKSMSSFHRDMWVNADKSWFHIRKDPVLRNYFP